MTPFCLNVSFNETTGQPVAAYLHIRDVTPAVTKEVKEGVAFVGCDVQGVLLGIELLGPCSINILDSVLSTEPGPVRRFIQGGTPRELVCA